MVCFGTYCNFMGSSSTATLAAGVIFFFTVEVIVCLFEVHWRPKLFVVSLAD